MTPLHPRWFGFWLAALALGFPLSTTAATPTAVLAGAPAADWADYDPQSLMVITLAGGGQVVIALADAFAPVHAANIRALARAHWYDGLSVERVQDDYVVQWGDPDGKKPLPAKGLSAPPAEYDRPAEGLGLTRLPYADTYAPAVGAAAGFPVAAGEGRVWLVHCYGMVGVGRDLNPDVGTGAELYAVIGQPPRGLDRNIAVVGRVLAGMDLLAALPRGKGDMGFYTAPDQRLAIRSVRIAVDMAKPDRPAFQRLREHSATFRAWVQARANRRDDFFLRPAGAVDVCNAEPPVRPAP